MKTSFYFVLWILIYPLLGLLHNPLIAADSFFVALLVVWGISWLLNRAMPETLAYERRLRLWPILEDIYRGDVGSFSRRLRRQAVVETVTSLYFCLTAVVVVIGALRGGAQDWVILIIFGFFAFGAIARSVKLVNAYQALKDDPTPQKCIETAQAVYGLNYASYYQARHGAGSYEDIFPPRPPYFTAFQIVSLLFALAACVLGLFYVVSGVIVMVQRSSFIINAAAAMYFLYGSLAVYFGVRDTISIFNTSFRNSKT